MKKRKRDRKALKKRKRKRGRIRRSRASKVCTRNRSSPSRDWTWSSVTVFSNAIHTGTVQLGEATGVWPVPSTVLSVPSSSFFIRLWHKILPSSFLRLSFCLLFLRTLPPLLLTLSLPPSSLADGPTSLRLAPPFPFSFSQPYQHLRVSTSTFTAACLQPNTSTSRISSLSRAYHPIPYHLAPTHYLFHLSFYRSVMMLETVNNPPLPVCNTSWLYFTYRRDDKTILRTIFYPVNVALFYQNLLENSTYFAYFLFINK